MSASNFLSTGFGGMPGRRKQDTASSALRFYEKVAYPGQVCQGNSPESIITLTKSRSFANFNEIVRLPNAKKGGLT